MHLKSDLEDYWTAFSAAAMIAFEICNASFQLNVKKIVQVWNLMHNPHKNEWIRVKDSFVDQNNFNPFFEDITYNL